MLFLSRSSLLDFLKSETMTLLTSKDLFSSILDFNSGEWTIVDCSCLARFKSFTELLFKIQLSKFSKGSCSTNFVFLFWLFTCVALKFNQILSSTLFQLLVVFEFLLGVFKKLAYISFKKSMADSFFPLTEELLTRGSVSICYYLSSLTLILHDEKSSHLGTFSLRAV